MMTSVRSRSKLLVTPVAVDPVFEYVWRDMNAARNMAGGGVPGGGGGAGPLPPSLRCTLPDGSGGLRCREWEITAGAGNAGDIDFASSIGEQGGPCGIRGSTVNPGPVGTDRGDGREKGFARIVSLASEVV